MSGNYEDDFGASSSPRKTRSESELMMVRMKNAMKRIDTPTPEPEVINELPSHVKGPQHILPAVDSTPKPSDDPVLMGVLNNLTGILKNIEAKKVLDQDDKQLLEYLETDQVKQTIATNDPETSADLARLFVKHSTTIEEHSINIEETEGSGDIADALAKLKELKDE